MICIDCLHISLNRILLLAVGLWPYQQSKLVQVQLGLYITIITTFIIFQFTTFLTSKCTPDLFINIFSFVLFQASFIIKYACFKININVVKYFLDQLQNFYNELTDKNEFIILQKYGIYAKRYTAASILIFICAASVPILHPFWPYFHKILLSINGSQSHPRLLFVTEYFIDQEKYVYLIILHGYTALLIGTTTMLATGTIFIVYTQHVCGMFRIVSYRIEQAMTVNTLRKTNLQNKNLIYKKLINAVYMHREAMKFADSSVSRFKIMFSLLIITGVICGILNLLQIFETFTLGYDCERLIFPCIIMLTYFLYMSLANYTSQNVIDHNNDVFVTVYNIKWYTASLKVQKMVLFLLQRGTKVFNLNIAGLFVGSLEGAATLLSTGISYFTVLYSTRN
ncbi:Odorant receptor 330 [Nylanderia fulva]|uniref:Odorant receptor n=2 Tax=Nylanderia fulva TaxID=613905 RepID=A0A6G1LR43_9HYME|nr:Odorant receptor 330 [Nylanderia fulva]